MAEQPYISVVILTARRAAQLKNCLQSLKAQIFRDFETVLVDNDPSPETETVIRESCLDVRLINNPGAPSYAEARNKGIDAAQGEFVAFLDDDCVADPAWLLHLSEAARNLDAVGGVVLPLKNLPFPNWWEDDLNWLVGLSVPGLLNSESPGVHYPQTANMMIRREILLEERFQELGGGFSQKSSRRYAGREDVELWRRLRLKGRRCAIEPRAIAYHDIPEERLRFRYLLRRAFNDGLAYWRRERKREYAQWAVMDIVSGVFRSVKGAFADRKKKRAFKPSFIWSVRQTGFLAGYILSDGFNFKRMGKVAFLFARCFVVYSKGVFKAFARRRVAGIYHKRRRGFSLKSPPEKLLIAACGFLGDMILLAPVLKGLRQSFPDAKITLLGYENAKVLFLNSGLVDETLLCPSEKDAPLKKRSKIIRGYLKDADFDAVLAPYYHGAPARPLFFTKKTPVITFDKDVGFSKRLWYDLAQRRVYKDFSLHEIQNLHRLFSQLGFIFKPTPFRLSISPDDQKRIDALLGRLPVSDNPLVLFHAGAGQSWKAWSLDHWEILASMIYREFGVKPVFIGDEFVGNKIKALSAIKEKRAFDLCWAGDIPGLIALIFRGDVVVTNDSGPKHIAMATGTPTICLYGSSDERRWGAFWEKERHAALRAVPADLSMEELSGLPPDYAMDRIAPEKVMDILRRFLKNIRAL